MCARAGGRLHANAFVHARVPSAGREGSHFLRLIQR